ncbi:hypothetical protein [Methanoculleus sp. UBA430]|uniref:hypothetical protein n=1 Tax=Methanoculleus sp. UBA430 TaxID=1915511 RepID=UPI0025D08FEC|nr:hypothetical protein [Methanoculleus sp. UBA430]
MTPNDLYQKDGTGLFREVSLPLPVAIVLPVATLLVLLGLLLFPVNQGVLPFSPDGQLGLLLVIMAIQMLALGDTPVGQYRRSRLLMATGIVFAAMGAVSCIVPGLLTGVIQVLLGLLNITGGAVLLTKRLLSMLHDLRNPPTEPVALPHLLKQLLVTQTVLNVVSITFGITMLVPGLAPGTVIAGIVVINGLLLFVLVSILLKIQ